MYDWLATIFIGEVIRDAQRHFLQKITNAKEILILGGGTGWLLKDINLRNNEAKILYVEASSAMIDRAKEFNSACRVTFLHGTELDLQRSVKFDVIITNFYLDLFSENSLREKIQLIKSQLRDNGTWLATDFVRPKKRIHKLLLWVMYRFFRIATSIEATSLPSWEKQMKEQGMILVESHMFKNDFIKSAVFSRR